MASFSKAFPTLTKARSKSTDSTSTPEATHRKDYKPTPARLPQVDLLPPLQVVSVKRRSLRFTFFAVGLLLVGIIALLYVYQASRVAADEQSAITAEEGAASLQADLTRFQPVTNYVDAVAARAQAVDDLLGTPAPIATTADTLVDALPAGGSYSSVSIAPARIKPGDTAAMQAFITSCGPLTDPFDNTVVPMSACVKIAGIVRNATDARILSEQLRTTPGLANVYVAQSGADLTAQGQVSFQGSFTVVDRTAP